MFCACQEEYRSLTKLLEGKGNNETFKSKVIASAAFQDVGLLIKGNTSRAFDRRKLRRQSKTVMTVDIYKTMAKLHPCGKIDGCKDTTFIQGKVGTKFYRRTVTGNMSSYRSLVLTILETFKLVSIGCGGTAVNTDTRGGVIRLLEEYLEGPLQWIICHLHANELPLCRLFQYFVGHNRGLRCFCTYYRKTFEL
jgi:hypothetical protein